MNRARMGSAASLKVDHFLETSVLSFAKSFAEMDLRLSRVRSQVSFF